MAHFAQIDENDIVINVIRAEQDFINSGAVGNPEKWIQTSYNTYGGQHPENRPLRKNFAGIGFTYDAERDAFIEPKPYESWILNEETCLWEAPIERPSFKHQWNEETQSWEAPE